MYPNGIAIPSKEVQLLLGHRIGCDEQIHNGFPGFPKKKCLQRAQASSSDDPAAARNSHVATKVFAGANIRFV